MRIVKIFKTRLSINNVKARLYIISEKLFEKSLILFDDINKITKLLFQTFNAKIHLQLLRKLENENR